MPGAPQTSVGGPQNKELPWFTENCQKSNTIWDFEYGFFGY